ADRQQELMLARLETDGAGGLFAEMEEPAQLVPEVREGAVFARGERRGIHPEHIISWDDTLPSRQITAPSRCPACPCAPRAGGIGVAGRPSVPPASSSSTRAARSRSSACCSRT